MPASKPVGCHRNHFQAYLLNQIDPLLADDVGMKNLFHRFKPCTAISTVSISAPTIGQMPECLSSAPTALLCKRAINSNRNAVAGFPSGSIRIAPIPVPAERAMSRNASEIETALQYVADLLSVGRSTPYRALAAV
jgi:hypothetical protein